MIEIELFYRTVEAEMRGVHASYLKDVKSEPLPLPLPEVTPLPSDEILQKMSFRKRRGILRRYRRELRTREYAERHPVITVDVRLLKGFNAGMEAALYVLRKEYERFEKRMEREERDT